MPGKRRNWSRCGRWSVASWSAARSAMPPRRWRLRRFCYPASAACSPCSAMACNCRCTRSRPAMRSRCSLAASSMRAHSRTSIAAPRNWRKNPKWSACCCANMKKVARIGCGRPTRCAASTAHPSVLPRRWDCRPNSWRACRWFRYWRAAPGEADASPPDCTAWPIISSGAKAFPTSCCRSRWQARHAGGNCRPRPAMTIMAHSLASVASHRM